MVNLDNDTQNWVYDRVDNNEALYWNEFILFMKRRGASKQEISKYNNEVYKNKVKKLYKTFKKSNNKRGYN